MHEQAESRWDLFLLLSLLLLILLYPVLDHGDLQKLILGILLFVPVTLTTIKMSEIKTSVWPSILLMASTVILSAINMISPFRVLAGMKWAILALFFGVTVVGLFSYLRNARSVITAHLYTAIAIYLLLGMLWFSIYSAVDAIYPSSFTHFGRTYHQSELLYFSLVTLSTVGYGDVVPLHSEVRILAALEGMTGVLYVAITVALLVNSYRRETDQQ